MKMIKAEDAKHSLGIKIQTNKYRIKKPIMQNTHTGKDLEDIVGKSVKPIAQSRAHQIKQPGFTRLSHQWR